MELLHASFSLALRRRFVLTAGRLVAPSSLGRLLLYAWLGAGVPCTGTASGAPLPEDLVERYVHAKRSTTLRGQVLTVLPTATSVRTSTRRVVRREDGKSLSVFMAPADQRGTIISDDGTWTLRYDPAERIVRKKRSLESAALDDERRLVRLILRNYEPRMEGMETVAGRACYRLSFQSRFEPGLTIRVWLDKATGAELRRDELDSCGSTVFLTLFTSVAFPRYIPDAEVTPSFPRQARAVNISRSSVYEDTAILSRAAGFPVRVPLATPAGYEFVCGTAATIAGRKSAFLRYTDGLLEMTVIETPRPASRAGPTTAARVLSRPYGEVEVDYALPDMQVVLVGRGSPRDFVTAAETMDQRVEARWRQGVSRVYNGQSHAVGAMRARGLTGETVVALLEVSSHSGRPVNSVLQSYLQAWCWRTLAKRYRVPEQVVVRQVQNLCALR